MAVFRLRVRGINDGIQQSRNDGLDWFSSRQIDPGNIHDSEGGMGSEPTSIPSPFARIDLVKSALNYVSDRIRDNNFSENNLQATTYHKIVSDYLDVAEIFFNYGKWADVDFLQIHEWSRTDEINWLTNSIHRGHRLLGDALNLYWHQDSASFNFGLTDKIYLLEYRRSIIIGGTSPKTLFFTSGNDLSNIQDIVFPNQNRAFSNQYTPLYERDFEFQKILYLIDLNIQNLGMVNHFSEFSRYLDYNLRILRNGDTRKQNLAQDLRRLNAADYNQNKYDLIAKGAFVFNNLPLLCAQDLPEQITSDFEIAPTKNTANRPLVLQTGHHGRNSRGERMKYYKAFYKEDTKITYYDNNEDLNTRYLPGLTKVRYPYLTVSDFLEPYLIRTNFKINNRIFYSALNEENLRDPNIGFILPLKRIFFEYFSVNDLTSSGNGNMPSLEIRYLGPHNAVTVKLSIPIVNNESIIYTRLYDSTLGPDLNNNLGRFIESKFSIAVFPFFKLADTSRNFSRVCLLDRNVGRRNINPVLNFYTEESAKAVIPTATRKRSDERSNAPVYTTHYVFERLSYDYVEIVFPDGQRGLILPKLKTIDREGSSDTVFAIDFGTTNTHIEFIIDNQDDSHPFEIPMRDTQVGCLHDTDNINVKTPTETKRDLDAYELAVLTEMMPHALGGETESNYQFPIRTAIAHSQFLDIDSALYAMADINIPFFFEKVHAPLVKINTDLKWSNDSHCSRNIEKFIENIVLFIRNKILLNNCSLSRARFIWFYPNSMTQGRRQILSDLWNSLYHKYFSGTGQPKGISESIAPFYWISQKAGVTAALKPVVSVDIGGETTDVVLFVNENDKQIPKLTTSFRFAGNAIFGDGFNRNREYNGFLNTFLPDIKRELQSRNLRDIYNLVLNLEEEYKSPDIIAALFSLDRIGNLPDADRISFNRKLYEEFDFKIVFVIFYSAIMFHLSKLILKAGFDFPAYIAFTGNGSKILNILERGDNILLQDLTFKIFSEVARSNNIPKPEIKRWDNAKEITCKGGVIFNGNTDKQEDVRDLFVVYPGGGLELITAATRDSHPQTLNRLNGSDLSRIISEFEEFLDIILKEKRFLNEKFLIEPAVLEKHIEFLRRSMMEDLSLGKMLRSQNEGDEITETLFFYPLIGGLNKLANEISINRKGA